MLGQPGRLDPPVPGCLPGLSRGPAASRARRHRSQDGHAGVLAGARHDRPIGIFPAIDRGGPGWCTVGGGSFSFGAINIRGPSHNTLGAFVGNPGLFAYFFLSELPAGAVLPAQHFGNSCRWSSSCSCQVCYGAQFGGSFKNFRDAGIGFIGFVFNRGAGTEYGWARVKTSGAPNYRFRLVDYAWGDPGDRIRTGQKSSAGNTVDAVTESGAIGLLALGAAGLVAWRKRGGQTT